jgi:hypothetical protein
MVSDTDILYMFNSFKHQNNALPRVYLRTASTASTVIKTIRTKLTGKRKHLNLCVEHGEIKRLSSCVEYIYSCIHITSLDRLSDI